MTPRVDAPTWRLIGASVKGANHKRTIADNQDSLDLWPEDGTGSRVIVAVSDGHGADIALRSKKGSEFAAHAATQAMHALMNGLPAGMDASLSLSTVKAKLTEDVPQEVVRRWDKLVDGHLEHHPHSEHAWKALELASGEATRRALDRNRYLAYGSTLLAVAVTELFIAYLQLGDGEILVVSEQGDVMRPLPPDPRSFANETASLSSGKWRDFRTAFQPVLGRPMTSLPALILLSTDGYSNSFPNDSGFLKVGQDMANMVQWHGIEEVESNLETWLEETTNGGSGDDITAALLCRTDLVPKQDVS